MDTATIAALSTQHTLNTYGLRKLALVRGEGSRLWDAEGGEYLDCMAGIAVVGLGHCHPHVTEAIRQQAGTLVHVSNLYYTEPQARLAERLAALSFAPRWFFANCGATANEAALKLARRYWWVKDSPKPNIIAAEQSFHGRSMSTLAVTGQPKYHLGFEPMPTGVSFVPFGDADAMEALVTPETGAILLEVIQGEGGIRTAPPGYFGRVRELCEKHGILLIFDEVQTGMGRTGTLFAYEHTGVTPDIITLAKALGNGVPIGAMGCTEEVAQGFTPGTHATTFGGNPLCCAAANATLDILTRKGFLEEVEAKGRWFRSGLEQLAAKLNLIKEVRGLGLMIGVELTGEAKPVIERMLEAGIICGPAGPNVVRFVPPLVIEQDDLKRVLDTFARVLETM